jgi:hypothetical protein
MYAAPSKITVKEIITIKIIVYMLEGKVTNYEDVFTYNLVSKCYKVCNFKCELQR